MLRLTRRTFAGEIACSYSRSSYRADRYMLWVPLRAPKPALTPRPAPDGHGRSAGGQADDGRPDEGAQTEAGVPGDQGPAMNGSVHA